MRTKKTIAALARLEAVKMVIASHALADEIRDRGEIGQPMLLSMALGMLTLQEFNGGLECLKKTALIEERGTTLKWKGAR